MKLQTITVLVVEDDREDRALLRDAFETCKVNCQLEFAGSGAEAFEYLNGRERIAGSPAGIPNLILLDLNLPGKNGLQILEEIKTTAAFKHIPVIVLTNSKNPHDIMRAYRLGANSLISKPSSFEKLLAIVLNIKTYWVDTVTVL